MRVFFVGNSYTLFHDVPAQVATALRESGRDVITDLAAVGGASLRDHWCSFDTRERLVAFAPDVVVLQERSTGPLHDREDFLSFGEKFAGLAREHRASVVLYETWPRAAGHDVYRARWSGGSPRDMQRRLSDAYRDLGQRIAAAVAPVGAAFSSVAAASPAIELYDVDGHHASARGARLAALVLARTLGASPASLVTRPSEIHEAVEAELRDVAFA